ncbi:MAG TPA: 16S rRNA (cytidine(1402)-2'-O)-methyltransferase [Microlunatus sp.]|nr:16S rRNA (cytidine(1402)-2'-O)-methyltransferase [Microlunatus sp.]
MAEPGLLVLAGTPIGDVTDASPALVRALIEADMIAAEDTRRLRSLLERLGASTAARIVSYFDGNEVARTPELVAALVDGATVVVATDAGMPSVSDPGYRVVVAAVEAGVRVTAVPGPSAVLTALAVSGLPVDRFCFEGFLPRKPGERGRRLAELAREPRTMVLFEAPHRTMEMLTAAADVLGADRRGVVCRELTKTYEEIVRGGLGELATWAAGGVRGEVTIVIAGVTSDPATELAGAVERVKARVADGVRLREAVAEVAAATGVRKNALYDAALEAR